MNREDEGNGGGQKVIALGNRLVVNIQETSRCGELGTFELRDSTVASDSSSSEASLTSESISAGSDSASTSGQVWLVDILRCDDMCSSIVAESMESAERTSDIPPQTEWVVHSQYHRSSFLGSKCPTRQRTSFPHPKISRKAPQIRRICKACADL